jgi:hypothetical protein
MFAPKTFGPYSRSLPERRDIGLASLSARTNIPVTARGFTDDYTEEDAIEDYLKFHPDADEAAVRAELQAEITKHGG